MIVDHIMVELYRGDGLDFLVLEYGNNNDNGTTLVTLKLVTLSIMTIHVCICYNLYNEKLRSRIDNVGNQAQMYVYFDTYKLVVRQIFKFVSPHNLAS